MKIGYYNEVIFEWQCEILVGNCTWNLNEDEWYLNWKYGIEWLNKMLVRALVWKMLEISNGKFMELKNVWILLNVRLSMNELNYWLKIGWKG